MADLAYGTCSQTWAWILVRATGTSVAITFLFFVALAGFARPETLAIRSAPLVLAENGR
ncbi:hypothetical protein [Gluconacetobacter tumulicola]|uniref:Uncharacterized protein n=1 Tax=Gluconacetobacter tumulicola TaxID=1017177 RepID=A0A7W4JGZ8_9PROT|nr:hypothetical protein [Gluconacetobacter tumulicola]MBB2181087.1 hypothetical protein [Gluconacetobacter tumulicola]